MRIMLTLFRAARRSLNSASTAEVVSGTSGGSISMRLEPRAGLLPHRAPSPSRLREGDFAASGNPGVRGGSTCCCGGK